MTNYYHSHQHCFQCASLLLDLQLGLLKNADGACQRLSPINLKLLMYLVSRSGELISRAEIFDAVWPNQLLSDDVLTRAVSDVRTQLAKLDADTKFIETLPKRGYRWVAPVRPVSVVEEGDVSVSPVLVVQDAVVSSHPFRVQYKTVGIYLLLALFLAFVSMWLLSRPVLDQFNIAVLPAVVEHSQNEVLAKKLDENLLIVLRNNPRIKLVSRAAIASRPQNPFPYFSEQFGVEWVIESRVIDYEAGLRVELGLVDARTGLEVRNLSIEAANNAELLLNLAKKLDAYFFSEDVGY